MDSLLQWFLTLVVSHVSLVPSWELQKVRDVLCVDFSAQFVKRAHFKVEMGWSVGRTTLWEFKVAHPVLCLTVYFFCVLGMSYLICPLPKQEIKFPYVSGMLQGPLVVFRSSIAISVSRTRWKKTKTGWTFVLDAH